MTINFKVSKLPWRWARRGAVLVSLPIIAIAWVPYVVIVGVANIFLAYFQCLRTLVLSVPRVWKLP